jgi:hypothetical protein
LFTCLYQVAGFDGIAGASVWQSAFVATGFAPANYGVGGDDTQVRLTVYHIVLFV